MSWNLPGSPGGTIATEPPSNGTSCTGDFADKLNCSEYGNFLWIGAFCVFVLICGLCSCWLVAPLIHWYRDSRESRQLDARVNDQKTKPTKFLSAVQSAAPKHGGEGTTKIKDPPNNKTNLKHTKRPSHHWYLSDTLRITEEDRMELGPPTRGLSRPSSRASGEHWPSSRASGEHWPSSRASGEHWPSSRASGEHWPSSRASGEHWPSSRTSGGGHWPSVVDDPGIGAEATAKGGGWMGAENGRL